MSGDRARDVDAAHAPTSVAVPEGAQPTVPGHPTPKAIDRESLPPVLATRYELKRVIGAGGMGLVYEALDLNLHRLVALKVLKLAPTKSEERADAVNRLVREARAMAALSHKNVVTVHDVGYHDDQVFVAMQLVEGTTLRQWLSQAKRTPLQILNVLHEAGSGLAAAHAARLIHRDFKPDNILVSQRGSVRVTDFGLARRSDGLIEPSGITPDRVSAPGVVDGDVDVTSVTRSGAIVGTPAYMAPEQASGNPCDARADQFSFCVTAWEALYGGRPFSGKNWSEIYQSVQTQAIALPPLDRKVPRPIMKALRRGLAVDPEERFPSMVELLDVFEHALRIPIRRRRVAAVVLAVTAVVAAVIITRNVGSREEPAQPVAAVEPPIQTPTSTPPQPWRAPADRMQHALKTKPPATDTVATVEPPKPPPPRPRKADTKATVEPPKPPPQNTAAIEPPKPGSPTNEAPPADTRLDTIKTARSSIDSEWKRRELLASDLPADYGVALRALDDAIAAKDADRALAELSKARAAIANLKIDRAFIDLKVQRLNARIGRLPKDRQSELTAKLAEVMSLFGNDQFGAANKKINAISSSLNTR